MKQMQLTIIALLSATLILWIVNWRQTENRKRNRSSFNECRKCHKTWDEVREHDTEYEAPFFCFALCEGCWKALETPEARLPYYLEMHEACKRLDGGRAESERTWPLIKAAVLEGK